MQVIMDKIGQFFGDKNIFTVLMPRVLTLALFVITTIS